MTTGNQRASVAIGNALSNFPNRGENLKLRTAPSVKKVIAENPCNVPSRRRYDEIIINMCVNTVNMEAEPVPVEIDSQSQPTIQSPLYQKVPIGGDAG